MEVNKILEFVREFNAGLEDSNEGNCINLVDNGFYQGIVLRDIYIWDDQNSSSECFKTQALSSIVRQLSEIQEVAGELLADEVDQYFAEKKKQLKEKFPDAKLKYQRLAICRYKAVLSGSYNDDIMAEFAEVLEEDFKYMFSEFKLDVEY